jgi:hypothetical protein
MGVDRTAWAGYGVTGAIDEPDDLLRKSKVPAPIRAALDNEDYDLETQMDEWLKLRGVEKVSVFVGGNSWSGVERWSVVVSSSVASVDESDPVEVLTEPSDEELAELTRALEMIGIETKPGWMLQMDVS